MVLLISMAGCDKGGGGNEPRLPEGTKQYEVDASSQTLWHYFSLTTGKLVGSAKDPEGAQDNPEWRMRKDWDIALQRYKIRTAAGVFVPDGGTRDANGNTLVTTSFASLANVPTEARFPADEAREDESMVEIGIGGVFSTTVRSAALVVQFWRNSPDGPPIMPPDYRPAPVCIFRTADGWGYYKVEFTGYKNELNASGHVTFNAAQIYPG